MRSVKFENESIVPCKIVCLGRNFVEHAKELGNEVPKEAVYFLKPNSSIGEDLLWREGLHYEAEICFLIRKGAIVAAAVGLDLTLRDIQAKLKAKGLPWERAKAFKGAALFSEFVPIDSWQSLRVRLFKNGELVQEGDTSLMIFTPDRFIEEIDEIFGLEDGDIIMSGTPKGVGPVKRGDRFNAQLWQGEKLLVAKEWVAF
jgi:2-keto-4-pentenoate hydratase/2-oxohepta-3-ene-1,7-dioic acid hydratase in catechol pathway